MQDKQVCVIGLGYVGLPTSAIIASKKIKTIGYDINPKVIEIINKGDIHIVEPDLKGLVNYVVTNKYLIASNEPKSSDIYIISVPTPIDENKRPDITYVENAIEKIIPILKKGDLIIIESTCPVGTTQKMYKKICDIRPELKDNLYVAYCPERVLPGNVLSELVNNDRIIGGINEASADYAGKFYSFIIKGNIYKTNDITAELCKLTENAYRDVNIAFANELSMICDDLNINVWELIELANKHPRVNILQPGPGVGGHCIAVDPWFIIHSTPALSKLMRTAREVNDFKRDWVINKIESVAKKLEKPIIGCLGITYKANIDDIRESPSLYIVERLIKMNYQVLVCDPYAEKKVSNKNFVFVNIDELIEKANIIVTLVEHKEFFSISKGRVKEKIVIDIKGIFR